MSNTDWQKWFEAIWADREERIYRDFFGDIGPGIYNLTPATFEKIGVRNPDPRWLHHGVFECPPNERRSHFIYASSGMSNPWGESPETVKPDSYSGLGFEFTLHTNTPGRWAIELMQWLMAVQLLVAAGELEGGLVEYDDRVTFRRSATNNPAEITRLLIAPPPPPEEHGGYPAQFQLASGHVDLMMLLAISEREADFARTQNADALIKLLKHHEIYPLTTLNRPSII